MKEGDLLFVYGSLRQGECADLSIRSGAEFVQEDEITGNIYNISWFPGVKLEGDNLVKGEVYKLIDASIIRHLDSYEGYPNLYDRSVVETKGGLRVWVYTYNHECGENERIASGDWLNQSGEATDAPQVSVKKEAA